LGQENVTSGGGGNYFGSFSVNTNVHLNQKGLQFRLRHMRGPTGTLGLASRVRKANIWGQDISLGCRCPHAPLCLRKTRLWNDLLLSLSGRTLKPCSLIPNSITIPT